jgi:ABC-2 type transport system permease protein
MNKISIVIKREYLTRVRKKSFLVLTFLIPLLFIGFLFGTKAISREDKGETKTIVVVDETGNYFSVFEDAEQYVFTELQGEKKNIFAKVQGMNWDDSENEKETSEQVAGILGGIFTLLIYFFILMYGAMVMQGVLEEKTNRIVEILVSSVKPFDLMMGKLIGIGLVGLTQFALWGVMIAVFAVFGTSQLEFSLISSLFAQGNLLGLCLYFILFFIGGFLMYAALFAAIGAMVNSQEDTQQYMMPITLLIVFAFFIGINSAQNPDGSLAFWASLIPFTSPIVMMTRLPYGVPWWELVLSISFLVVSVILIVQLAAKIYRVGILMYGKKPSYSEIIKWLKY